MTIAFTFQRAISLISKDFQQAKKYLDDQRLTQTEKKIIQGYGELRVSNFDWILSNIPGLITVDKFVEAQKHLLIGIALNNNGRCDEAEIELIKSRDMLDCTLYPENRFLADYNLFVAQQNLQDVEKLRKTFLSINASSFVAGSALWIRYQRLCFNYYAMTSSFDEARKALVQITKWKDKMDEHQSISWIIDQLKFYIKIPEYSNCYQLLQDMKGHRSFYLSADYNFIKATLDFLTKGTPIYLYDRQVGACPLLYHQTRVLTSLEEVNIASALEHWNALTNMSPSIYQDELKYAGDICLFSRCLEKLLDKLKAPKLNSTIKSQNKADALYRLLLQSPHGIRKELIYQEIWGGPLENKEDLVKLSKLLQRVKLKHNIDVISRKGTYVVIFRPQKKQA